MHGACLLHSTSMKKEILQLDVTEQHAFNVLHGNALVGIGEFPLTAQERILTNTTVKCDLIHFYCGHTFSVPFCFKI